MDISVTTALIQGIFGWKTVLDIVLIAAGLFFLYRTLLRLGTWRIVADIMLAPGDRVELSSATAEVLEVKGSRAIRIRLTLSEPLPD